MALVNLKIFRKEKTLAVLRPKIALLKRLLKPLADLPLVGDIRQRGMMVSIELVRSKTTREAIPLQARIGHRVATEARRRGLLLRPIGNVIVLMPPLSSSRDQLSRMVEILGDSIDTCTHPTRAPDAAQSPVL